ncbi:hypothetical protein [Butyricimonas sp. Marseille-P3923]|uniref:hypothetical protein n=1 Tax=Butyricimonas sp. Marseille-P3923 TaxID=1987504 RepID=UPI000C08A004|nr:hypothetical protein [Butyricimonas sp. Marseille-P3923]
MKHILILGFVCLVLGMGGCVQDNFIKSGLHSGRFDGSLLEYLKAPGHSYDWDSTARLVEQAGPDVVRLFEGKDTEHPEITFLGPTNHSIRRYMLENDIERISDMEPDVCKDLLLQCIIDGKLYRDDVPRGKYDEDEAMPGEGGKYYPTLSGSTVWLYTHQQTLQGIPDVGAVSLGVYSQSAFRDFSIASSNIEPDHCVVHSLSYNFTLGDFGEMEDWEDPEDWEDFE